MAFQNGHALVIGVGTHLFHREANVPIAVTDAQAVAEVLQDATACGYPSEQVQLLHDDTATRAGILAALDALAQRTTPDSTVFLFFCGHGALGVDGNYHLVTHDAQLQRDRVLGRTGVSEGELLERLRKVQAERMLVIFNACYSGNLSPSLALEPASLKPSNPSAETAAALLGTGSGRIILTACREEQVSYIGSGDLSIFTQALVDGLRGRGLRNNGGYVSAFNLYEHVYEQVRETVKTQLHATQEPELTVLKGVGPFAVALYKGASSLGGFDSDESLSPGIAVREVTPQQSARLLNQRITQTGGGVQAGGDIGVQGGDLIGRDKTSYLEEVRGDQIGGDRISVGHISGSSGIAIGRGAQAYVRQDSSDAEIQQLFAQLLEQVQQTAPRESREEAVRKVRSLQEEAAKGRQANDARMAGLVEELVALVPVAVTGIVGVFATPALSGVAGSVTTYVLEKLRRQHRSS